jgi:hypothetical protein
MDGQRFDELVKRITTTRLTRVSVLRGVAASALAALTGAAGAGRIVEVEAAQKCRNAGQTCEGSNPNCCPGTVCDVTNNPTTCQPCGAQDQLCCPGFTCPAPLVCVGNRCVAQGAGGGGGIGGAAVRCTSNADCPGGFCNTGTGQCFVIQGLSCRSGESADTCCRRSVKKGCKRKQQTAHARQNCQKKGKKRCASLLRGIA